MEEVYSDPDIVLGYPSQAMTKNDEDNSLEELSTTCNIERRVDSREGNKDDIYADPDKVLKYRGDGYCNDTGEYPRRAIKRNSPSRKSRIIKKPTEFVDSQGYLCPMDVGAVGGAEYSKHCFASEPTIENEKKKGGYLKKEGTKQINEEYDAHGYLRPEMLNLDQTSHVSEGCEIGVKSRFTSRSNHLASNRVFSLTALQNIEEIGCLEDDSHGTKPNSAKLTGLFLSTKDYVKVFDSRKLNKAMLEEKVHFYVCPDFKDKHGCLLSINGMRLSFYII